MEERSQTLPRRGTPTQHKPNRPSSYYDNLRDNGQSEASYHGDATPPMTYQLRHEHAKEASPTQEFLLKTTVPQNLAAANIMGKHMPTRNSLRHSRMIVMSRTGQVPRAYFPHVVRCHKLATTLAALQSVTGAAICCLAAWLLLWAPNLKRRDNPYWSGLPLLASGTFGLLLLCCCRRGRPGSIRGYIVNFVKICSIILSLTAAALSFIAAVFAFIHLMTLAAMTCDSTQFLNETCVCKGNSNSTFPIKSFHYADLKCSQVDETLTVLLIFSCVVNTTAGIVCLWYVYLHCSSRNEYTYSKVKTKDKSYAIATKS